jgi:acetyl-CoA synthase
MSEDKNFDAIFDGAVEEGKEPKKLFREAYHGAITATSYAEILLNQAIGRYGEDQKVQYPDTAYYLPVTRCWTGEKVATLKDMVSVLNKERGLLKENLTFENVRLAGRATWIAAEVIEAVHYIKNSQENPIFPKPWTGFIGDPVVRQFGIKMVDWTIPGEAVILGRAKTSKHAKQIVDDLMSKGFMIFLCDEIIEQLMEENVKLGVDYIAYPLGNFTQIVHAADYALRAGMMFGGVTPGKLEEQRDYQRRRIRAFVLYLGEHDMVKTAAAMGAIYTGFPVSRLMTGLFHNLIMTKWFKQLWNYVASRLQISR